MRKLLFSLVAVLIATASVFAGNFEAKPINPDDFKKTAWDRDYEFFLSVSQLFTVPEEIDPFKDIVPQGVEVDVKSSNPEVVEADYHVRNENGYIRYTLKQQKAGIAEITVALTYQEQTTSNTFTVDVAFIRPKTPLEVTIDINNLAPTEIDVLSNCQFWNYPTRAEEMKNCRINLLSQPAHGTAEILTGEGEYPVINYTPADDVADFTKDAISYEIVHPLGQTTPAAVVSVNIHHNLWATRIIDLLPAPGQFVNTTTASITNAQAALERKNGFVASLGSFGGYIVYGFDAPIKNDPRNPYGIDFQISGNPLNAGRRSSWWSEAGAVQVMKDLNGNGIPDDGEWYELAGSDYWLSSTYRNINMTYYNPGYQKRYTVPFTTDKGFDGAVLTNQFHQQPYYPLPQNYQAASRDQITFTGHLIKGVLDKRSPSYIEYYRGPAFGYCDNWGSKLDPSAITDPYNQKIAYESGEEMPQDGFDISWAVDKDGNHVELDQIDFVRVYCALWENAGWLGEASTEPGQVVMTIPDENYEPADIYLNYAGITQLQVPEGHTCRFEGLVFCNGRPVTEGIEPVWTVDDENVGTIDSNGLFTAKALGKVRISYQGTDKAIPDEFDIQVVKLGRVVVDLEGNASGLDNSKTTCIEGETIYINVESETTVEETVNQTTANRFIYDTYTWENSDPTVGTITNSLFKALAPGVTTLTVVSGIDSELKATIEVTVEAVPELEQLISEIEITEENFAGTLTSSQIFKAGEKGSMVYLDNFCDQPETKDVTFGNLSAAEGHVTMNTIDNTMSYNFENMTQVDETVSFNVTNYSRTFTRSIRFFKKSSGVNNVSADADAAGNTFWYNMQGICLGCNLDSANMAPGIYILRRGNSVRKIKL